MAGLIYYVDFHILLGFFVNDQRKLFFYFNLQKYDIKCERLLLYCLKYLIFPFIKLKKMVKLNSIHLFGPDIYFDKRIITAIISVILHY